VESAASSMSLPITGNNDVNLGDSSAYGTGFPRRGLSRPVLFCRAYQKRL